MAVKLLPPEGFDLTPIAFLISTSSICLTLLLHTRMARTAASRILDQAERLDKQLGEQFKAILAADRSEIENAMLSYVVTTMIGFALGFLCGLVDGMRLPLVTILNACMAFFFLPRPWRMWTYRTLHDVSAYTLIEIGYLPADFMDNVWKQRARCQDEVSPEVREMISEESADRETISEEARDVNEMEDVEATDEVATDTEASHWEDEEDEDVEIVEVDDEMDETEDSWSFDLDTPSETGSSLSSGTSISTHSVPASQARSGNASVRETTFAPSKPEDAKSILDAFFLLHTAQDPREPHSRLQTRPDWFMSNRSTGESPESNTKTTPQPKSSVQTSKQMTELISGLRMLKSVAEGRHQPMIPSNVVGEVENQPADVIIFRLERGADTQERMLVRIHKTTPLKQLKDRLRNKDEDACELMVKESRRDFPVFDNETPSSVSFCPVVYFVKQVEKLMLCFLDAIGRIAALGYVGLGAYARYAKTAGHHWKGCTCLSARSGVGRRGTHYYRRRGKCVF